MVDSFENSRVDGLEQPLQFRTFLEPAPWILTANPPWRSAVQANRRRLNASLPGLTKPPTFPPLGRMIRLMRVALPTLLAWAVGARRRGGSESRTALSKRLRVAAETLGPTYIKLGQIIASGDGLFPSELVDELKACRDQVPAEDFTTVKATVVAELGRPLEEVFEFFDRTPLAAASIAQVHVARLHPKTPDTPGVEVVVKVQRAGIQKLVTKDLQVMAFLAPRMIGRIPVAALANPPSLVELFAETIVEELDFRLEADNMLAVAETYDLIGKDSYVVPRPHPDLVTERVLVMERLHGIAYADLESLLEAGIDTEAVVRAGMIGFLEGMMIHGVFHGDLHAGNLLVLQDGRTALLDFGITGRLSERERLAFLRMVVAGTMNDVRSQLEAVTELGALPSDTDIDAVIKHLKLDQRPVDPATMTPDQLSKEMRSILKALLTYGARLPKPLMLFVKNMIFIDGSIATLAPDLDLFGEINHIVAYFATTHGDQIAREAGLGDQRWSLDMDSVRSMYAVDDTVDRMTYRELTERRELIASRLARSSGRRRKRR